MKAQFIAYHKLNVDNHGIFAIENLAIPTPKIFKVKKFACKSLKEKGVHSGIRVTYAYFPVEDRKAEKPKITEINCHTVARPFPFGTNNFLPRKRARSYRNVRSGIDSERNLKISRNDNCDPG